MSAETQLQDRVQRIKASVYARVAALRNHGEKDRADTLQSSIQHLDNAIRFIRRSEGGMKP